MNSIITAPRVGLENYFKLQVRRSDGSVRHDTGWFKNLITDYGLNLMGTANWGGGACVGSGNTAPAFTDTQLQTWMASTNSSVTSSSGQTFEAPYYGWIKITRRITATAGLVGTIREVGLTTLASPGTNPLLWSRALVPTPFAVGVGEALDVTWERRLYSRTTDTTGTITMDGILRNYTVRSSDVAVGIGTAWFSFGGPVGFTGFATKGTVRANEMTAFNVQQAGTSVGLTSGNVVLAGNEYVDASLEMKLEFIMGLTFAPPGGEISIVTFNTNIGNYKVGFDPILVKSGSHEMSLRIKFGWGRKT